MNQRVKRAIAAAMSLTMVATATPVSPLYDAIQTAVSSAMMQASAEQNWNEINEKNLHWKLEDNGKLTVDLINPDETDLSKNAMPDWNDMNDVPWYEVGESITSVEIKEGVTSIGDYAFDSYINIGGTEYNKYINLKSVKIPASVTTINKLAFNGCKEIENIIFAEDSELTIIGEQTFCSCENLKTIALPAKVKYIGYTAFCSCENLKNITIPAEVEYIDGLAFLDCTNLENITFEGAMPVVNSYAFYNVGTTTPAAIYYPKDNASWETFLNGKDEVFVWEDGKFKAEAYLNWNDIADTNLHWAISVNGTLYIEPKDKTATTGNAMPDWESTNSPWYNNTEITSVKIEDGVTNIGSRAFWDCSELTDITIPNSVTSIGNYAFEGCTALTDITIPSSITSINNGIFNNCESLKNITIPNSVTEIGDSVFYGCESLESITIPNSVTSIGKLAFEYCPKLTSLTIPDSVTNIGTGAFFDCSELKEVNLGKNVKNIGAGAFGGVALKSIVIPSSVETLGDIAFFGCQSLTEIKFEGNVPQIQTDSEIDEDLSGVFLDSGISQTNPAILYYPKDNASWEEFLAANAANIDANGILSWEEGYFKPEAYLVWNEIEGINLKWTLDLSGKLTIDLINPDETDLSKNAMPKRSGAILNKMPWSDVKNSIKSVVIGEGVTNIADYAFYNYPALTEATISDSVTSIGKQAFEGTALESVTFKGTKPAFGNAAFSRVGKENAPADLHYTKGDASWNGIENEVDGKQWYGGYFKADCKTQLTGVSLSLDGKIGVNISFYVNKDKGSTIKINGKTVDLTKLTSVNGVYTYTLLVAPRNAYNEIEFDIDGDSTTIDINEQYVEKILADTSHIKYSEKDYNMVSALDTYINSSRVYFGEVDKNEENAIRTSIASALENLDTSGIDKSFVKEEAEGVAYYGSSLILNSGVKLRHYITIDDFDNKKDNITINVGDDEYNGSDLVKSTIDNVYYFETAEFNPKDFGTNVSVTYNSKKVIDNYSVLTFIKLSLDNAETAAKDLGTTCKSIYNYYLAADNYKN